MVRLCGKPQKTGAEVSLHPKLTLMFSVIIPLQIRSRIYPFFHFYVHFFVVHLLHAML